VTATCGTHGRVDSVLASPDPRTADLVWTIQPCGCEVEPAAVTHLGVPGTIIPVTGANLIGAERVRVVTDEGYSVEDDRKHTGAELAWAVWCLVDRVVAKHPTEQAPPVWPFDRSRWPRDKTPLRLLIIAGQFIAAEIDRRLEAGERP